MKILSIAILISLTLCFISHADSSKIVAVPRASDRITIDGRLNERGWLHAGSIPAFEHHWKKTALKNQTQVLLAYDDNALYVAFICKESDMKALKASITEHDGSLWNDDCVEVFLDTKADRASYAHFVVNPLGAQYDALGSDPYGWNPQWEAKTSRQDKQWKTEIRIPFSELGIAGAPASGSHWLGNFCREAKPYRELSCWSPTMGSFDSPGAFGKIVFGSLKNEPKIVTKKPRIKPRKPGTDYLVWETTPWKHFSMKEDISNIDQDTTKIDVVQLAGQTESKALMVSNLTDETLSARILIDGFEGMSIETLIPTFVRTADERPYPDALVPPDPIAQIIVPAGETRQIWLNIKGMQAGKFSGKLTVSPLTASKIDKQVQFNIDVVKPPIDIAQPLVFTWDYLGDAAQLGLEKEYIQSMADHGVSVFMISGLRYMPRPKADDNGDFLEPVDWSKFERQVNLVWQPGRKLYITMDVWEKNNERPIYNGRFGTPGWCEAFSKIIQEMTGVLTKLGLSYNDYIVNPLDETIDERYLTIAKLIKEADPKIKLVEDTIGLSLDEVKEANKYTDYWIPHFRILHSESVKQQINYMKSTGKPVGFYFYSEGANEKANDSYSCYLWKFWQGYSDGLDGIFGYWTATQHYGNPWNRHQVEASYDPSLFYYGNGCVITGRRWEAWRRGIEDLALLNLCEKSGIDKALISEAVKSVLESPTDPTRAAREREKLIGLLRK